ncbi:MAG: glucose-1-phosphate adenylyltransferase [Verrucomicrobia bacterium]|jgi:glucose-1-phosphate adenylyltransferase|nr:glucose-1-phosphate adenylyltransferase [Verrucomicrobiota bacterium]
MASNPIFSASFLSRNVLSVILGGGAGTRLYPLTKERSKPAVPLGGKYRLVDVPISNCINSGLQRVFVMTQFLSASLHRHISQSYKFDHFSRGFVEILAAEQTPTSSSWYEGTADAVRKNLTHLTSQPFEYLVILSGDQLYRMDYLQMLAHHMETGADLTVATIPVRKESVSGLGIMQMNDACEITRFEEKPKDPELQQSLQLPRDWYERLNIIDDEDLWLASMGIYIFNRQTILELLDNAKTDFGKHIIPDAIKTHKVSSYVFQGYWEDVGTIKAFFEANLDLTSVMPKFNFFDMQSPVFTRPRFLPASKVNGGNIQNSLLSDGCIVQGAQLKDCMLGIRSIVGEGADLEEVVMMGGDYYESEDSISQAAKQGRPRIGIGANTQIRHAIIDKNARIGKHCRITPDDKPQEMDHALYHIRDGIVIIPKNAVVPDGTVI